MNTYNPSDLVKATSALGDILDGIKTLLLLSDNIREIAGVKADEIFGQEPPEPNKTEPLPFDDSAMPFDDSAIGRIKGAIEETASNLRAARKQAARFTAL